MTLEERQRLVVDTPTDLVRGELIEVSSNGEDWMKDIFLRYDNGYIRGDTMLSHYARRITSRAWRLGDYIPAPLCVRKKTGGLWCYAEPHDKNGFLVFWLNDIVIDAETLYRDYVRNNGALCGRITE